MTVIDYSHYQDEVGRGQRILRAVSHVMAPVLFGGLVTVILFYVMQALIASRGPVVTQNNGFHLVDFVRIPKMTEVQTKNLHPKKPPPPEQEPPVKEDINFKVAVDNQAWGMQPVDIDSKPNLSGGFSFASDGNYLPIVKVQPIYPTTAEMNGLEGWVVLQFTVDELGRVVDPIVVDDCAHVTVSDQAEECEDQPNRVFDQAALNAARKFKYRPKIVNGVAVPTPHVRHKFTFVLSAQ